MNGIQELHMSCLILSEATGHFNPANPWSQGRGYENDHHGRESGRWLWPCSDHCSPSLCIGQVSDMLHCLSVMGQSILLFFFNISFFK